MERRIEVIPISSGLSKDKILELSKEYKFQVFDLESISNRFQIQLAYFHSVEAFKEKKNITQDLMLEWLVRASGERQIKNAIKSIGLKDAKGMIVAFDRAETKLDRKKLLKLLEAKEIKWNERDDPKIISKMVELEIEE